MDSYLEYVFRRHRRPQKPTQEMQMEHFFSAMEHALHTSGQTGHTKIAPPKPPRMRWPKEFKSPIDAALHLGTPKGRDYRTRGAPPYPSADALQFFG